MLSKAVKLAVIVPTLASAALLLWPAPAVHAQGPLTLVPNSVNMFRSTRAPNNVGVAQGDRFQYGANIQGGSAGSTLGASYPPDGFVDPQFACAPLAVNANFCARSNPFNANRIATPWSLQFMRGADQLIVPGPDLTVNGGAILNPVPFPSSFVFTAGPTPVTPTISWALLEGFVPDGLRVLIYDKDDRLVNGAANVIHSVAVPPTTTSYSIPAVLSSGRTLNVDGNYAVALEIVETRGHVTFTNNQTQILRASLSFFDFTPRPPDILAQSTFPTGTENWFTFISGEPFPLSNITWIDGAGNPGGAVSTLAPSDSRVTYFANSVQFPAAMRATPNSGLALSFDLSTIRSEADIFSLWSEDIAVLQTTGLLGKRIVLGNFFTSAPAAHPSYSHYEINFTVAQGWEYLEGGIRTPATQAQIDTVLANAVSLIIRGEYWGSPTPDTTFLDNVMLISRATLPPTVTAISTQTFLEHRTTDVIISGTNFQSGARADFGPAVGVNSVLFVSPTQLIANVTFLPPSEGCPSEPSAVSFDVSVVNPDEGFDTLANAGSIVPDCDGDGLADISVAAFPGPDNCPDHINPGQEDSDGDGIGNACDLCAVRNTLAQNIDEDGDGIGDGCTNTGNHPGGADYSGEVATINPPTPPPPGSSRIVTATFHYEGIDRGDGNGVGPITVFWKGCFSFQFTVVRQSDDTVLAPIFRHTTALAIPADLATFQPGESRSVQCDLGEMYDPTILAAGTYDVHITFSSRAQDPDLSPPTLQNPNGVCGNPPCFAIDVIQVTSPPALLTIGPPPAPTAPQITKVEIDIEPGIVNNVWPCRLDFLIPVAVLGSADFDASKINHKLVRFGKTGTEALDPTRNLVSAAHRLIDVNRDGFRDMLFTFRFKDTGFSCADIPAGLTSFDVNPILTGPAQVIKTVDGVPVPGQFTPIQITDSDTLRLKRFQH